MQILIEPIINDKIQQDIVQGEKFFLSLRVTNKTITPSENFTIESMVLFYKQSDIVDDCENKSYFIRKLNPDESLTLEIGYFVAIVHGLISLKINARSENNTPISFLQSQHKIGTKQIINNPNEWIDFLWVESKSENNQKKTNIITLWLNILLLFIASIQIQEKINIQDFFKNVIFKSNTYKESDFLVLILSILISLSALIFFKKKDRF
ncbi:MAG: hypothetical protein RL150_252 [Candidatus Parcubacteria bacterium]|jgi:hypothetical protein